MLRLYNSLSRQLETFKPIHLPKVGVYTCGPTVYQFAHIGNFRAYSTSDILVRALRMNGYEVKFVMNITDVGHLVSDEDTGEDKMEKSAKKEGKTALEVAQFYTKVFLEDYEKLGFVKPDILPKATEHIKEQIDLIKTLEEKGYTYKTTDGIYFDTSKFPEYGKISTLDQIKEGARVEVNPEKRNPRDFALWKFSYPGGVTREEYLRHSGLDPESVGADSRFRGNDNTNVINKRQMEWRSPWGIGFPGWHIECSAMSMKYLGPHFDIHTGGIDHLTVHHPDEIAQSEAATGETFVNYWVHTNFMLVNGEKMSKSKGNFYRLYDLEKEGFSATDLRYLYMNAHYRQEMNFTMAALESARNAMKNLREKVAGLGSEVADVGDRDLEEKFKSAVNDDLNMPEALAVMHEMLSSDIPNPVKMKSLLWMDEVLGLHLKDAQAIAVVIPMEDLPEEIQKLVHEREVMRAKKLWAQSDHLRNQLRKMGYELRDTGSGIEVRRT